jgi:hypothetical protein
LVIGGLMIGFAASTASSSDQATFSAAEVLNGIQTTEGACEGAGRIWAKVDGRGDCLRFYAAFPEGAGANPVIFLEGDTV